VLRLGGNQAAIDQVAAGWGIAPQTYTPVAATPDYGYDPSNLGSFGASGGGVRGNKIGYAQGGLTSLDTYAAGGKLLHGPGDGVSDSIPAVIQGAKPQRAALAQGEFVIPARIVSELGNGSTDAGAKRLYAMMDRVQKARGKTVGKGKVAVDTKPEKLLPA
jgi:hypothetical protein